LGIVSMYLDQTGKERRYTSDETRVAILAAMGIEASTPRQAEAALRAHRASMRSELLERVRVVEWSPSALTTVHTQLPSGGRVRWRLEIDEESGATHRIEGESEDRVALTAAHALPIGYHRARLQVSARGREYAAEQSIIVVPPRCTLPDDVLGDRKTFGVVANLYTLHSERNWGIGDFTDLATLAAWTGEIGGAFVGVNPLHALLNRGNEVSPYSPVSRLFRNVAYLDVEAIPELRGATEIDHRIALPELRAELAALREDPHVRYEEVMALKEPVLSALHRRFVERERDTENPRARAYREFVRAHDPELTRFATWLTIGELQAARGPDRGSRDERATPAAEAFDWRRWPDELRNPTSPAVRHLAESHAERVDYHRWLQFECERQLGAVAEVARRRGMAIGLYQDLAIGTSPAGSDVWSNPELFVRDANVGAPPDPYAASGQNWGLPPIDPRMLQRDAYRYYVRLLRSGFRHAGALRIDHVMGLFRLFWIPRGMTGKEGAYIRYPWSDLLGILALESVRHRALVVGEDLGTVPKEVPPALAKWGVLSSKVLYFEREKRGGFKSAERYPALSLATANTHDLATIVGFWRGRDVELRVKHGLVEAGDSATAAQAVRSRERQALVRRLRSSGMLATSRRVPRDGAADAEWERTLRHGVHAFLCSTPATMVGLSLDDLAGEVESVNLPGVAPDVHPSWRRKMRMSLEELTSSELVRSLVSTRCAHRGPSGAATAEGESTHSRAARPSPV
jgi:4-alpha-glucanotransferase